MDYHSAYFPGAAAQHQHQQPYHFMGMPPLTPSHSNSGPSEDFNTTPPQEIPYSDFNTGDQYQPYDHFPAAPSFAQAPPPSSLPGPPTPPNQGHAHAMTTAVSPTIAIPKEETLDQHLTTAPLSLATVQHQQPLQQTSSNRRTGSQSAEEEETAPAAMSKRKAQNRAAQRAFRERKERHVKELEAKLASLEAAQHTAATENEQLKRDLQKVHTENEILRATAAVAGSSPSSGHGASHSSGQSPPLETGPLVYNPTEFVSELLDGHENKKVTHRIVQSADGEPLYDAGATWDFVVGHGHYKSGMVDIGVVSEYLKGLARCDGQGPVFRKCDIERAIESAVRDNDELI